MRRGQIKAVLHEAAGATFRPAPPPVTVPALHATHDTSIELWTAYRRRRLLPGVSVSPWPWIVSIVAGFVLLLVLAGCGGISPQTQADRVVVSGFLVKQNAEPEVFEAWGRLTQAHDEAAKLAAVTEIVKPVIDWAIQLGLSVVSGYVTRAVEPETGTP